MNLKVMLLAMTALTMGCSSTSVSLTGRAWDEHDVTVTHRPVVGFTTEYRFHVPAQNGHPTYLAKDIAPLTISSRHISQVLTTNDLAGFVDYNTGSYPEVDIQLLKRDELGFDQLPINGRHRYSTLREPRRQMMTQPPLSPMVQQEKSSADRQ